jgi:RNA polymerase sigma-70 factor, ECF subfamily
MTAGVMGKTNVQDTERSRQTAKEREQRWSAMMQRSFVSEGAEYRALLKEISQYLRGFLRSNLARGGQGNSEEEDILQETLIAIHLKRQSWDQAQPFMPWLNAVARHKFIDAMRRRGRHNLVPIDGFSEVIPAPAAEPSDQSDVERMLAHLPERQQSIVRGMSIEGRTAKDVGAQLGLTDVAVRVALHRALKALAAVYRTNESQ